MASSGDWYVYSKHISSMKNRLTYFKCFAGSSLKKGFWSVGRRGSCKLTMSREVQVQV
jgi:hypothetical protein